MLTVSEIKDRIRILEKRIDNIIEEDGIFIMDEEYAEINNMQELVDELRLLNRSLIEDQNVSVQDQTDIPSTTSLYSLYVSRVNSLDASEDFRNSLLPRDNSNAYGQNDNGNSPVGAERSDLRPSLF